MSYRASALLYSSIVYVGFGLITSAIGPLLPELARRNGVGLAEIGLVFTALFLGAVVAQLVGGEIADRIGRRPVYLFGLVVMVVATGGLVESRIFALTLAVSAVWGIGLGAAELAANVLAAELFPERSVSALNLLNVFYGLGAFAGPALVSLGLQWWRTGSPALLAGAAFLASQVPLVARLREGDVGAPGAMENGARMTETAQAADSGRRADAGRMADAGSGADGGRVVYLSPLLWVIGAALFVYVGAEQMVGGWAAVFMERTTPLALSSAALVASAFWVAFTLGRAVGAGFGARLAPRAVLAAGLATAAAGALLLNLGLGNTRISIAGFLLIGLGFGPIYPTTIAIAGRLFAGAAGKAIGAAGALGSAGGMILPFLDGLLIGKVGPASGALFAALAIVMVVALIVVARAFAIRATGPVLPRSAGRVG